MTTTAPAPTPGPRRRRRGFEGTGDMLRSLGLVLLVVVPIWFLAQPGEDAEQEVRVVDQSADVRAWQDAVPAALLPRSTPAGWRATVSDLDPAVLRLGWVTPERRYAEFASTTGPAEAFVEELVGGQEQSGTVDVDGAPWARYEEEDGSVSLVLRRGGVTVVVGTRRGTVTEPEVVALARAVQPAP